MNLLILGATGSIGRHLVPLALEKGHQVTALVRDPAKLAISHAQLRTLAGDALQPPDVEQAVRFQDAVIYALGADQMGKPTTLFSDSTRILLEAMKRHGVRRLVAITGIGAGDSKGHGGFFYDQIIYRFFTKPIYEDKDRQEELIRASDRDWTIVRPSAFTDHSPPGAVLRALTDLGGVTVKSISRADTAAFVLEQVSSDRWLRQSPLVGY
jgi:putative NADH-flavin reductase